MKKTRSITEKNLTDPTMELTNPALRAIRRLFRATELSARKVTAATGLTPSQLLVLQEIERCGETTPGIVASALQFGQATVTNVVDRLEAMGFVTRQRSNRDKRQIILCMTAHGAELLQEAPDLLQTQFRERFGDLPAWEQAMILAALERLGELFDASDIDAAPLIDSGAIDR